MSDQEYAPGLTKALTKLDARGNICELTTARHRVLFSYGCVVAVENKQTLTIYRTGSANLTQSMKRHITRWIEGREASTVGQKVLEEMAGI